MAKFEYSQEIHGHSRRFRFTKALEFLLCLIVPAFYMGCSACSDDEKELSKEEQFKEQMDAQGNVSKSPEELGPEEACNKIPNPCNGTYEGTSIKSCLCSNGEWHLKD